MIKRVYFTIFRTRYLVSCSAWSIPLEIKSVGLSEDETRFRAPFREFRKTRALLLWLDFHIKLIYKNYVVEALQSIRKFSSIVHSLRQLFIPIHFQLESPCWDSGILTEYWSWSISDFQSSQKILGSFLVSLNQSIFRWEDSFQKHLFRRSFV